MVDDSWKEWSRHVLKELERLNACYIEISARNSEYKDRTTACLTEVKLEIAKLKVKAGVWGLIGGAIPVFTMLAIKWLS